VSIKEALHDKLKTLAGGRVYPNEAPQNVTTPYIVWTTIADTRMRSLTGFSGTSKTWFQVSCYHTGKNTVETLAKQVVNLVEPWQTAQIQAAWVENATDGKEKDYPYHVHLDIIVVHHY
jgi:hypothetical protein